MAETQIFLDNFTDSDGVNLQDHTPDVGSGWTLIESTGADIHSNAAVDDGGTWNYNFYTCDPASLSSHYIIRARESFESGEGYSGIHWRVVNTGNYYAFRFKADDAAIAIYEAYNYEGSTLKAETAKVLTRGTYYDVVVEVNGDDVTCTVDGASVSYTMTRYPTETTVGLLVRGGNAYSRFDSYEVVNVTSGAADIATLIQARRARNVLLRR